MQVKTASAWKIMWNEIYHDKIALLGLILFILIVSTVYIWAIFIDPVDAGFVDLRTRLLPPSSDFWLGTDSAGRDMLHQLILSARNSFNIAFLVTAGGATIGILFGLFAGFYGGHVDNVLMRLLNFIGMVPFLMLIIIFVSLIPSYSAIQFAGIMILFSWQGTAVLLRIKALQQGRLDYVAASKTLGTPNVVIIFREVLPNLISIIVSNLTLAMAINQDEIGELLFNGLHFAAGSFIPPNHAALMDLSLPGFPYNPELANQILDDAGFTMGADGFRTWPDGSPLVVNWGRIQDLSTDHIIVPLYQQSWAAIGINVQLWQGRTHDQNVMWDVLDYDDDNDEIHIYTARWANVGPNPQGRWGHLQWNPSRYTSEEFDRLVANLSDIRAFDQAFMRQAYAELQAYMQENVFFFPGRWQITLTALNNRVARWDTRPGIPPSEYGWQSIRLTAAEPYSR